MEYEAAIKNKARDPNDINRTLTYTIKYKKKQAAEPFIYKCTHKQKQYFIFSMCMHMFE